MGDLHVEELGRGEPVLFVHGSGSGGATAWAKQRSLASDFRLLIADRRGFGESPSRAGRVDFELDAADVADVLGDGAHLVGHSYGGVVSLLAAARRLDRVRSLTVIEPPAFGLVRGELVVERFIERVRKAVVEAADPNDFSCRFAAAFGFQASRADLGDREQKDARSSWGERPPWEAEIPLKELVEAPFPILVARGAWDTAPPVARESTMPAFHAVCDVLEHELRTESATFAGAAHSPQHLGGAFNERLRAFVKAA